MADLISIIADLIELNTTFVLGESLQVDFFNESAPDRCTFVSSPSGIEENNKDTSSNLFKCDITLTSRSYDRAQALEDLSKIHNYLYVEPGPGLTFINDNDFDYEILGIICIWNQKYDFFDNKKRHIYTSNYTFNLRRF